MTKKYSSLFENLIAIDNIKNKTLDDFLAGNDAGNIKLLQNEYKDLTSISIDFRNKANFDHLAAKHHVKINWGGNFSQANMNEDSNIGKMNVAKLEKAMNKVYRFECGVMSLKEFLVKHPPVCKKIFTQEYTTKKIHLCYERLKTPKISYHVGYLNDHKQYPNGPEIFYIEVPKMYYDSLNVEVK